MDRNIWSHTAPYLDNKSLSARRAWIEIPITLDSGALPGSLSARRAWIEIIDYIIDYVNDAMSLSARRAWIEIARFARSVCVRPCRSPQGERG